MNITTFSTEKLDEMLQNAIRLNGPNSPDAKVLTREITRRRLEAPVEGFRLKKTGFLPGERLRGRRLEHLISVRELADEADVSANTIRNIEAGRHSPRAITLRAVNAALENLINNQSLT